MEEKAPESEIRKKLLEDRDDLSFPGRQSLIENIQRSFAIKGDVWIHHGYNVPEEDPLVIDDEIKNIQYQDKIIVPAILHTLVDKVGGMRTTSIAAICGMKTPELLLLQDPATMNLAVIYKEKLWITEILLKEIDFLYPLPTERTQALTDTDRTMVEVTQEDISLEINGHRAKGGIIQEKIFIPLDSYYHPILGGRDPAGRFKSSLPRLPDSGELILMISDAITSSAKMYLGTVNVRLDEGRFALEYPQEVNVAGLKIYRRYLDVIEIRSPSNPPHTELQRVSFRVYRTEISRHLKSLIKILHVD
ncbi:MAG: hypothetical protein JSW11_03730 [Candidatus Heimdallarchaeota archaeon]|nr:MAG: hypothetical protein JSW11_03730 [Candidatus Heimdallarchaeota archaeon]